MLLIKVFFYLKSKNKNLFKKYKKASIVWDF